MKCDVFISYSRADVVQAESLCKALELAGVDYWIDRNIHGSANFLTEITRYISSCKVVLFIASSNSAKSEWTQREILFALKHHKEILPYRIENFSFADNPELDFIFTTIQWIESEREVIASLDKLDCCGKTLTQTDPTKTYKVGDYYNDGVREGVVFDVSEDGRHGKIVSMKQSVEKLQWVSDKVEECSFIGANNESDGLYNMARVKDRPDWREKYPAFAWCAALGEGWYLPSINELKQFTLDSYVRQVVNRSLSKNDGVEICGMKSEWFFYWSSTETSSHRSTGEYCARYVSMYQCDDYRHNKGDNYFVRAVEVF